MPLLQTQLHALRLEFQNDPRGYGYAAVFTTGQDNASKDIINTVRDGTNPPTNPTAAGGVVSGQIRLNNVSVDTGLIRAAVTFAGFNGLVAAQQAWFEWLTSAGFITVNAEMLQQLAGVGPSGASGSIWATGDRVAMNAAMEALLRKNGSRAEELFGVGVAVTQDDVHNCRTA